MTRPQVASRSEVARGLRASGCAAKPRRGSLLYKCLLASLATLTCACCAYADFAYQSTITPAAGDSVEVEFPQGEYSNAEPLKIVLPNTGTTSVRLNGTNTVWQMPDREEAYPTYPFWITQNGQDAVYLKPATALLAQSPLKFSYFDVTTCWDKPRETLSTVFNGGTYNFYDPNGTAPATTTLPVIYFDNKNGRDVQQAVFNNATTRFGRAFMAGSTAVTNRFVMNGGTHYFAEDLRTGYSSAKVYETYMTNGANVTIAGEFRFYTSKQSLLVLEDSTLNLVYNQRFFGNSDNTPWILRAKNSTITCSSGFYLNFNKKNNLSGHADFTNCQITVANEFNMGYDLEADFCDCNIVAHKFDCGTRTDYNPGEKTRVCLRGQKSSLAVDDEFRVAVYDYADVDLEFAGGTNVIQGSNWRIGENSSQCRITISGGVFERRNKTFQLGYGSGAAATLSLTGGTLLATTISKGNAGATANLIADGGTFKTQADSGSIISGLDSATIGPNGFTIDTNGKNVTINQSFTGTGNLILQGGGSVTFASGCTVAGGIVAKGGTKVIFGDMASVGSLTVGKDGTECVVSLAYGHTLAVGGDIDVGLFKIEITGGTYEKASDFHELFRIGGSVVGSTAEQWEGVAFTSGISGDGALDAYVVDDQGEHVLGFKVRDPVTTTIAIPAGEDVVTNRAIKTCPGDTIVFDIGDGGSFSSAFPIKSGAALVKRGSGTLTLSNPGNSFASVTNEAGTIVLRHPDALGGLSVPISGEGIVYDFDEPGETASTFTVAKAQSNEAIRVEIANKDVTMPLYDILNGGIVKDGRGAVSFMMPDQKVQLSIKNATPWKGNKSGDAGFKIRQGEVAFRGRTSSIRELTYAYMGPGIGVDYALEDPSPAPPKLVFDHIEFSAAAAGISFAKNGTNPSAGEPTLIVTNSASVNFGTIALGTLNAAVNPQASPVSHVLVDNRSLLRLSSFNTYPNGGILDVVVDNCSTVAVSTVDMRGYVNMTFRNNSELMGVVGGKPSGPVQLAYAISTHETSYRFESGSVLRSNLVGERLVDRTSPRSICRLTFAGGEWNPCADTFTVEFARISGSLFVEGDGLILAPGAGQTWTVGTDLIDSPGGAGGLVKRGAGTVVMNAAKVRYTGATRLEGGLLDLDGSTAEGMTLEPAGGTVANGTLVRPTYRLEVSDEWQAAHLAEIDPSMVQGRVTLDLGRTEANPLPLPYASVEVATYTGDSAPDVSKWHVVGTGRPEATVVFSVDTAAKKIIGTAVPCDGLFIYLR